MQQVGNARNMAKNNTRKRKTEISGIHLSCFKLLRPDFIQDKSRLVHFWFSGPVNLLSNTGTQWRPNLSLRAIVGSVEVDDPLTARWTWYRCSGELVVGQKHTGQQSRRWVPPSYRKISRLLAPADAQKWNDAYYSLKMHSKLLYTTQGAFRLNSKAIPLCAIST